jgi:hypothetical protein
MILQVEEREEQQAAALRRPIEGGERQEWVEARWPV